MVPKIRFSGLEGSWKTNRLSELTEIYDGTHQTPIYKDSGIMFLSVEDIKTLKSEKYISEEAFKKEFRIRPVKGDVLMTRIGDVGTANVVEGMEDIAYYVSLALIKSSHLDPHFLRWSIHSPFMQNEFWRRTLHIAFPKKINKNEIGNALINVPDNVEQSKIGWFFKQLEDTINLQQQELDTLKQTKQGFLQKMFPKEGELVPELRFPRFDTEWELRSLGEVAPLRGGFAFQSKKFKKNGVPIVRISNIQSNGEVGGDYAYYEAQPKDEKFLLKDGAALLAMSGATTGKVAILKNSNKEKVYQNQRVGFFTVTKKVNYDFISIIVRSPMFTNQLKSVLVSGAQPNVSSKEIDSFEFLFPKTKEEQIQIGTFFKQFDEVIALQQQELDALKQTKKAFLQKMFV